MMQLYLIGFMGAGKSAAARELAQRWGVEQVDLDAAIAARAGRSIAEIFASEGEPTFRELETRELQATRAPIVACGGGLPLKRANREWMRLHGRSVWLDAPLATLRRRVESAADRPLWKPDQLRGRYQLRRARYALADDRVDAGAPLEQVVDELDRRFSLFFR